jgi:Mn2+/Fe2+ NRAMP family transporter
VAVRPRNLAIAVQADSEYSYSLIWMIAVSTILMLVYADMNVRLGIRTPVSRISSVKDVLGRLVGVSVGIGVFIVTLCSPWAMPSDPAWDCRWSSAGPR